MRQRAYLPRGGMIRLIYAILVITILGLMFLNLYTYYVVRETRQIIDGYREEMNMPVCADRTRCV